MSFPLPRLVLHKCSYPRFASPPSLDFPLHQSRIEFSSLSRCGIKEPSTSRIAIIFSLIPLAALAVAPALAGTISARKEDSIQARDCAPWTPGWSWPGTDSTCHPSIPENCPCLTKPTCSSDGLIKCPEPTCDYSEYNWHPIYENWNGWNGWKKNPYSTGYVNKDTYEIDCKNLCNANEGCNSCQVYTLEEAAEVFICALFEEIIDITTWEDDCDDWNDWSTWGCKPSWSSCWSLY